MAPPLPTLSVEQAQARILDGIRPLEAERVPVGEAAGRVAAVDVPAVRDQPPKANSAMDGFAARWQFFVLFCKQ